MLYFRLTYCQYKNAIYNVVNQQTQQAILVTSNF